MYMKVYSLYSSYLNVLIKTLQLQAKVENIKNAEIRKLALFQWGGAISPACRLFQWVPQHPSPLPGHMQLACNARVLERAASALRLPLLPSRLHAGKPVWSRETSCARYCRLVGKRMRRLHTPTPVALPSCSRSERSDRWRKAQLATRTSMRSNTALRTSWARVGARKTDGVQSHLPQRGQSGRKRGRLLPSKIVRQWKWSSAKVSTIYYIYNIGKCVCLILLLLLLRRLLRLRDTRWGILRTRFDFQQVFLFVFAFLFLFCFLPGLANVFALDETSAKRNAPQTLNFSVSRRIRRVT